MPEHKTLRAPYEPLTPPEIRRDNITGRFERKGTLAKAAKFKQDQPAKRRPGGTPFQPGVMPLSGSGTCVDFRPSRCTCASRFSKKFFSKKFLRSVRGWSCQA